MAARRRRNRVGDSDPTKIDVSYRLPRGLIKAIQHRAVDLGVAPCVVAADVIERGLAVLPDARRPSSGDAGPSLRSVG